MKTVLAFAIVLCTSATALQEVSGRCSMLFDRVTMAPPDNMTTALLDTLCESTSECNPQKILNITKDVVQSCDPEQVQSMSFLISMLTSKVELPCAKSSTGKYCMASFSTVGRAISDRNVDLSAMLDTLCDSQCVDTYKHMGGMASQLIPGMPGMSNDSEPFYFNYASPYAMFPSLCAKDGNKYCLAEYKETAAKVESGDLDAAADLVCSDCFRRMGNRAFAMVINNVALPSYGAVCQKDSKGQLCLRTAADAIKSLDIKNVCSPKNLNSTECSDKITQLVNQIGCCAASALPFIQDNTTELTPDQKAATVQLFGDVCKPSSTGKVVISFMVDNLNWVKVKASWDSIKANVSVDIAVAIGVEASEVSVSVVGASGRRSSPSIVAEVSPSSTSYTAQDVSRFASSALKSGITFSTLSSATFLQDPTKPSTVSGGSVSTEGDATNPDNAASGIVLAAGVAVAAVALHL
eukprot:m51a1_g13055 hypothetical protein (466) ;mRNA; f:448-2131